MDHDAEMARGFTRQQIVEQAVHAADYVILDNSEEAAEINRRTVEVAKYLLADATAAIVGRSVKAPEDGIVFTAANKALRLIATSCPEESGIVRNSLRMAVVMAFVKKVEQIFTAAQMLYDIQNPAGDGKG